MSPAERRDVREQLVGSGLARSAQVLDSTTDGSTAGVLTDAASLTISFQLSRITAVLIGRPISGASKG